MRGARWWLAEPGGRRNPVRLGELIDSSVQIAAVDGAAAAFDPDVNDLRVMSVDARTGSHRRPEAGS